ncbi:protein of unknown function DUF350 [Desulfatibacillum aliphaticivorans]|uniref:DUF350 domain-containing protein n=1 Tax=Desulfatibacillum aliphaticivorans TaxID=218208 RepID=B8FHS9_DESAL|nr:DUF350 domain-containing protein [Desulfatibacillum aliphaticivorans]ACL02496.1 protein of unknown function DUF350 [Desulfatibacillum aliphaticivorans]
MMQELILTGHGFVYAVIVMVYVVIAKKIMDWRTKDMDDDYEIEEKSNPAVGLQRAGLYLGIALGMSGALTGGSMGFVKDVITLAWEGALIVVLLFVAREVCDRVILRGIDNDAEAADGNAAVGFAELGVYVASGLVLAGAFAGEGGGLLSALVFFVLGQMVLFILYFVYEKATPFNIREEIKNGNAAAGLNAAGMMVALGVILRSSIAGPAMGWTQDLSAFAVSAGAGLVMLFIFRWVIDWLLLPNTDYETEIKRDQNIAAIALTEGVLLSVAIIIAAVL